MSHVRYELTAEALNICESTQNCYGIRCLENGVESIRYPDILPDKEKVEELVDLCNALELDPLHLEDVLLDFLP